MFYTFVLYKVIGLAIMVLSSFLPDFAIQAGLPENPDGFVFLFQIVNELKEDLAVPKSRD